MATTRRSASTANVDDATCEPLIVIEGDAASPPADAVSPRNKLNNLTAREWMSESVSVWNQRGLGASHPEAQIERQHPAPFSFSDVARLIRLFTKPGMTVLDPFVGVGSTLKACALEGRSGIGFELNPTFATLAEQRLSSEVPTGLLELSRQRVMQGDARQLVKSLDAESIDFLVTSPPYWGILNKKPDHKVRQERLDHGLITHYGDDDRDFANLGKYSEFVESLGDFFGECRQILKPGSYCAIVIGDFRHGGRYYMLHADVANALEQRGYVLKAVNVLYQRHKRVFPYGYPAAYVSNVHHQNIIIMRNEANK